MHLQIIFLAGVTFNVAGMDSREAIAGTLNAASL